MKGGFVSKFSYFCKETKKQRNKETKKQRNKETKKQRNKETKKQRNKEMVEKPIFAAIMTAAMVSGSLISTNTEDYANQKNVELKMDEYWADSDSVESEKVSCEGENTGEKSVYYIIEYMDKDGKWRYSDTTLLVGSGLKCPILSTGRQNNKTNFRLQLNPYGTKKAGAKANGRIWPAENK